MGMAAFFSLLAAMAVWSYLYGARSAGLLHALPIRREGLFFTGFLAGAAFSLAPNALLFLLTLGAEQVAGAVNLGTLGLWLLIQSMYCLFFFCFATFCAFVTGHILVLPAFYVIFNFLAVGILGLVEGVLHDFVYGFDGLTGAWPAVAWLSPRYKIAEGVRVTYERQNGVAVNIALNGVYMMVIYTAAGLVLAALALFIYRRHQVERAGEVVTASWLRPVFKYGVAFCGALSFGSLFYAIFRNILRGSAWGMLFFVLLWGALSYYAAEMLLQKSFRVFKKGWRGCAVFLLVVVALIAAMELDLTGYERRVPELSRVKEAVVSERSSLPYDTSAGRGIIASDPALIGRVISLHQSAVAHKAAVEQELARYYRSNSYAESPDGVQTSNTASFDIFYTLSDGRTLTRSYTVAVTDELLSDPASPPALLTDFLNNRTDLAEAYFPAGISASDFAGSYMVLFGSGVEQQTVNLTADQAEELYRAALADLDAGTLGRRYLLKNREYLTEVYQNEITLSCLVRYDSYYDSALSPGIAKYTTNISFYPQTDSVHLIAALDQMGLLDENHRLVTMADLQNTKYQSMTQ
jgi:ABC-2 type transport system permease protein